MKTLSQVLFENSPTMDPRLGNMLTKLTSLSPELRELQSYADKIVKSPGDITLRKASKEIRDFASNVYSQTEKVLQDIYINMNTGYTGYKENSELDTSEYMVGHLKRLAGIARRIQENPENVNSSFYSREFIDPLKNLQPLKNLSISEIQYFVSRFIAARGNPPHYPSDQREVSKVAGMIAKELEFAASKLMGNK